MFRGREADVDGMPLFWLELFDHVTKTSVDSFRCDTIKDAAAVFEDFMSQGANLNGPRDGLTRLPSPTTGSMPADMGDLDGLLRLYDERTTLECDCEGVVLTGRQSFSEYWARKLESKLRSRIHPGQYDADLPTGFRSIFEAARANPFACTAARCRHGPRAANPHPRDGSTCSARRTGTSPSAPESIFASAIQLARIEGRCALKSLFRRWPELMLAVDPSDITWRKRPGLRAIAPAAGRSRRRARELPRQLERVSGVAHG